MPRTVLLVAALIVSVPALNPVGQACGDKFLMAGHGAKFQRAYASVYPGKVLIYARSSTDPKAAIRDPQLHKVLRQAGHAVSVVEDWARLEKTLKTEPIDIVLVDVADAVQLRDLVASSSAHPDALYVEFASKGKTSNAAFVCRLKASDGKLKYLDEIENAMKARTKHAKNS